ncbi:MAG: hypothetical protein Tsb0021_11250 [Chlamydiales bacterium]
MENTNVDIYNSGMDYAPCNGVMEKDGYCPSETEINEFIHFFADRKVPFVWWTSNQILENFGFQYGGILTGIALDMSNQKLQLPTFASEVSIKLIQSEEEILTFSHVAVEGFGMPSHTVEQFAKVNIGTMKAREQLHFLAYFNKSPVGTVTLSVNENSAGIWNLATLANYRKSGIGKALIASALMEAKNLGHKHVMAILMPKGMAWGIFMQLGFVENSRFPFYVFGDSAENLE